MVLPIMILGRLGVFVTRFRGARCDSHRPRDPLIVHDYARIYARRLPRDLDCVRVLGKPPSRRWQTG